MKSEYERAFHEQFELLYRKLSRYGRDGITPEMAELWKEASKHIPEELLERVLDFQDFCRKLTENKDFLNRKIYGLQ